MAGRVDFEGIGEVLRELLQPEALADPYPVYERLRREQATGARRRRLVLGHADAIRLLSERTWSSDRVTTTLAGFSPAERVGLDPLERTLRAIVAFQDPPAHARLRRLLQRSFTPAVVRRQREVVVATAARLVDRFAASGRTGDVLAEVLLPLPAAVVAGILGIPEPQIAGFQSAAQHLVWWFGAGRPNRGRAEQTRIALREARALVSDLLAARRARPTDDLLSAMLTALDEEPTDGKVALAEDEILANAIFLMTAGHETAANALANSLVALLAHAHERDGVGGHEMLPDAALCELLRFDSPVQLTARIATDDRETVVGPVRRGESVVVVLGAANRDPERFEEPQRLQLDRADNQPLSFGWGAHYCLGASLAKEELRIVLPHVLRRLRGLELAGPLTYQPTLDFRGPTSLPVRWR